MSGQENPFSAEFTPEELSKQAQGNALMFALATLAYLKKQGQSGAEWAEFAGRRVAPGWEELRGQGANVVARIVALNLASVGATIHSVSGDDRNAEVTVSNWPPQDTLEFIGVTRADTAPLWRIFRPIVENLSLHYEWQEEGEQIRLRLSQL